MPLEAAASFQALMQSLLAERMEAARLGMLSLAQDCIEELRCLIHGGSDVVRLKAIELLLGTLVRTATNTNDEVGTDHRERRGVRPRLVA